MGAGAVTVLMDAWRAHPLAWIHRAEARGIAGMARASQLARLLGLG
jgi:hypothetical protein